MALDEEKDLDTSQDSLKFSSSQESLKISSDSNVSPTENIAEEIIKSVEDFSQTINQTQTDKNQSKECGTDPIVFYDNDLAYELQQSGIGIGSPEVTSWHDISKEDRDTNKTSSEQSNITSWHDIPNDSITTDIGSKNEAGQQRPLSETEKHDREMKKKMEREKSRSEERELATSILSPRAPLLSMQALTNIDLGIYTVIFLPQFSYTNTIALTIYNHS